MDVSQIKMVVTDLDGTLLNSNHEVSPRFLKLFKELRKKNILFVAASGRYYSSMADKLEAIKDDSIIISSNGALVQHRDTVLLTTPLHTSEVHRVLEIVEPLESVYPILSSHTNAFVQNDPDEFLATFREHYPSFSMVENLKAVEAEVLAISLYHCKSSEEYIYPAVQHLEEHMKVKVSGARWADISHNNAHKGYALKKVMDQHQIAAHELMVFGDYHNDLEMLQLSDFSFAMANAHPHVKKVAKYETKSNNEFGVETVLEQLL